MRTLRTTAVALAVLAIGSQVRAADPTWPKEMTFTIMATENPAEVTRRWGPILAQLEADLGVKVKPVVADFLAIGGLLKSGKCRFRASDAQGVCRVLDPAMYFSSGKGPLRLGSSIESSRR